MMYERMMHEQTKQHFLLFEFAKLLYKHHSFIDKYLATNKLNIGEKRTKFFNLLHRRYEYLYRDYGHDANFDPETISRGERRIVKLSSAIRRKLNTLKKRIASDLPITIRVSGSDNQQTFHPLYRSGKQAKLDGPTPVVLDRNYSEPLEFELVGLTSAMFSQGKLKLTAGLKLKGTNYHLCAARDQLIFKKINDPDDTESMTRWDIVENKQSYLVVTLGPCNANLASLQFSICVTGEDRGIYYDEQNHTFSLRPISEGSPSIIQLEQSAFHDEIDDFLTDLDHIDTLLAVLRRRNAEESMASKLSELTTTISESRDNILSTIDGCLKQNSTNNVVKKVLKIGQSTKQSQASPKLLAELYKINTDVRQRKIESQIAEQHTDFKAVCSLHRVRIQPIQTMISYYVKHYLYLQERLYLTQTKAKVDQLVAQIEHLQTLNRLAETAPNPAHESLADIITSLQTNKNITSLYLNLGEIKPRDLRRLLSSLNQSACLQKLNLSYSTLGSKQRNKDLLLALIFDFLKTNTYLSQLNLNGNILSPDQCRRLADAIEQNKSLKTLCLSSCGISSEGMGDIIAALQHNKNLDTLMVDGNNRFSTENIELLQSVLSYNNNITEIVLPRISYILYPDSYLKQHPTSLINPLETIKQSLEANKQVKQQLVDALKAGAIQELQQLLAKHPGLISFKDKNYNNLAHLAVRECNYQLLAFVLPKMQDIINPLIANNAGKTPLDLALELRLGSHAELLRQYRPTFCLQKFIDQWFLEHYKDQRIQYTAKIFPEVTTRETGRELISSHIEEGQHIQAIEIPEWTESHKHEFSSRVDKTSTVRYSINDTIELSEDKSLSSTQSNSTSSGKSQESHNERNNSNSTTDTHEKSIGGSVTMGGGGLFIQGSASGNYNDTRSTTQNSSNSETNGSSASSHQAQSHEESKTLSHSERHSISLSKDQSDELMNAYSETITQEIIVQPDMRYEFIVNEEIKKQRVHFNIEVKLTGEVSFTTQKEVAPANYEQKVSVKKILEYFATNNALQNNLLIKDNEVVFKTSGQMELSFNNHITLVRICPYWKLRYLVTELAHEMLKTQDSWRVIPIIAKDGTGTVIEKLRLVCNDSVNNESGILTDVLQTTLKILLGKENITAIKPVNSSGPFLYIDIQFLDLKSSRELLEGLTFVVLQQYFLEQLKSKEKDIVTIVGRQAAELMASAITDLKLDQNLKAEGARLIFSESDLQPMLRLFCTDYLAQEITFARSATAKNFELDLTQLGTQNLFVLSKLSIVAVSNAIARYYSHHVAATKTLQQDLKNDSFDTLTNGGYLEVSYAEKNRPDYANKFKLISTVFNSTEQPIKSITDNHCSIPIHNITHANTQRYQWANKNTFWNRPLTENPTQDEPTSKDQPDNQPTSIFSQ